MNASPDPNDRPVRSRDGVSAPAGRRHAVIVGINDYGAEAGLKPLKYAEADATLIAATLAGPAFGFTPHVLLGQNATRPQILGALHECSEVNDLDIFLFYFSGHGEQIRKAGTHCLHCFGSEARHPIEVLALAEQAAWIAEHVRARRNVLIIDACRDDMLTGVQTRGSVVGLDTAVRSALQDVVNAPRDIHTEGLAAPASAGLLFTMLACGGGGVSYEDDECKHGVFTLALVKEIEAHGTEWPLSVLVRKVGDQTRRRSQEKSWRPIQIPDWIAPALSEDVFLGLADPDPLRIDVVEMLGVLAVTSDEDDVALWIDGAQVGTVTRGMRSQARLREGRHQLTATKGDRRFEATIDIKEDETTRVDVRLPGAAAKPVAPAHSPSPEHGVSTLQLDARTTLELVRIEPGTFQMGSNDGHADERPVHQVTLTTGFELGKYPVTQAQWVAVMGTNPSRFTAAGLACPVEQVSWEEVQQFVGKLNARGDGYRYRLPTEAEWEYAARAGTTGDYAGTLDEMAWYDKNSGSKTHPVGQKRPNAWGVYDMHGNVWEWVSDWWANSSPSSSAVTDPTGPSSAADRVIRGGSWLNAAWSCRSAFRNRGLPGNRYYLLGFRLLRVQSSA